MVDDLRFETVVSIDVGDQAIEGFQLFRRVFARAANVYHLDADRPGVHAVIRRPIADGNGAHHVVAAVFRNAELLVVARVAVARVMRDLVERHALHDRAVLAHDEVRRHARIVAIEVVHDVFRLAFAFRVVQDDVLLEFSGLVAVCKALAEILGQIDGRFRRVTRCAGLPRGPCGWRYPTE